MAQYSSVKSGSLVNVTNGSNIVTGTGSDWLGKISVGDGFTVAGTSVVYDVASVDSDTQLTLTINYSGPSATSKHYTIHRDFTSPDNIPELSNGDIETGTIMKRLARVVQGRLNVLSGLTYTGLWTSGTLYPVGSIVIYDDGTTVAAYVANTEHTAATDNQPPDATWDVLFTDINTVAFTSLSWIGDWAASTEYFEQNVVRYNDNIYVAKANFVSGTTFDATNFDILIDIQSLYQIRTDAEAARDKAQLWANEVEDVIVEGTEYSAKHYSAKSEGFSISASQSASQAATSASNAVTSENNALTSANNAATSESNALTSENNAANSATAASTSAADASIAETGAVQARDAAITAKNQTQDIFEQFGDQYLGPFASDPTTDNSGNPLTEGDIYFNTTDDVLKFYSGTAWVSPENIATNAAQDAQNSATAASTSESNALTYSNSASTSANLSEDWATLLNATVDGLDYSSKHYSQEASTSASAASTSASNAATSESNAATSETNALTSESMAEDWAENPEGNPVDVPDTATTWVESTAYILGNLVVPTTLNGYYYEVTTTGTTGTTEPTWPTTTGTTVSDGGVVWTTRAMFSAKHHALRAEDSATAAYTSESNAATSASNAATSETNAATSETNAATSETNALTSENNAATSESNALASANTSEDWATLLNATVDGTEYSSKHYSQEASVSASNASTSASNALTSENNASTSASNALTSENKAEDWAENPVDIEVEVGKFSALHHSSKASDSAAAASTSESNASTSASNALTSANNAATSESNALTSADLSEDWATLLNATVDGLDYSSKHYSQEASTSASNASTSEQNALASENKAQQWADAPLGTEVEPSKYSARHWAEQLGAIPETAYNWQGDWVAGTYNAGDAVFHVPTSSSYITLITTTTEPDLAETSDWQLLARAAQFQDADVLSLNDTPSAYTGAANQFVQVNGTENGLVFANADNYGGWTLTVDGVSRGNIDSSESVDFVGGTNTTLSYNATGNVITVDSLDTTYSAGTGITLTGTTFSLTDEAYTTTEKNKLAGIESGATADQTASEILTAIKTVDGSASGLDADLLDGNHASAFALDSSISTVGKTGSYNDLTNKPDLSSLEDVHVFASTAGFPATGSSGVVYIAEDTGYMYRWNGTNYTQMTDQTAIWGQISGTLSNQTDLQNALNAKLDSASAYTSSDFDTDFGTKSTTDLSEGKNLYYTDARARGAISVSGDLSYSSATGVISFSETYSTASEIKTAYESNLDTNAYTDSEKTKLSGIESGATADQTASEILTAIKTVDGSTSGLDADLLDGNHASAFALAGHTHSYDNYGGWTLNTDGTSRGNIASSETVRFNGGTNVSLAYNATDNAITISSTDTNTDTTYTAGTGLSLSGTTFSLTDEAYTTTEKNKLSGIESGATADQTASEILTAIKTVDGSGSGLDADTLDGIDSLSFVRDTGDTLTGTYTINTADDGVNDLQVGGTSRFQGNAGFGDSSPDEKVDVAGNARIQNENAMKFGGTGAADAQYAIQYNAATKSLDFNFLGA